MLNVEVDNKNKNIFTYTYPGFTGCMRLAAASSFLVSGGLLTISNVQVSWFYRVYGDGSSKQLFD